MKNFPNFIQIIRVHKNTLIILMTLVSLGIILTSTNIFRDIQTRIEAATVNSVEPEDGTITGDVTIKDDANASGGKYISFGTAQSACVPTVSSSELVSNGGYEGTYSTIAPSWSDNNWDGATFSYNRDTTNPHGGDSAQKIAVSTLGTGGLIFKQDYSFKKGQVYEGTIWLRSDTPTTVQFLFRRAGSYYEPGAIRTVTLNSNWQKITIRGGFGDDTDTAGFFGVNFVTSGTVYIDDASLREVSETDCVDNSAVIPANFFGMHINKWGTYNTWPSSMQFGIVRLWDTGTRWKDIEPTQGNWDWVRFDYYVNTAVQNNEEIIYTMGITPHWASARPADPDEGGTAEPTDINTWRNYVRTVATRYKGKIKYWEIWNEVNYGGFYTGSTEKMVELTQTARDELKAVDSSNVILGPNFTDTGFAMLDEYLIKGGGQYVDIITYHAYSTFTPEYKNAYFAGIKNIMKNNSVDTKPLWNTEGASYGTSPTSDQAVGSVARNYILQWAWGVSNFNWYGWDIDLGNPLSQPGYLTTTPAGVAYQQTVAWLQGAQMVSKHHDTTTDTWYVKIQRANGYTGYIVWNATGSNTFTIPTEWNVTTKRDLAGGSTAIGGSTIQIGLVPLLLE